MTCATRLPARSIRRGAARRTRRAPCATRRLGERRHRGHRVSMGGALADRRRRSAERLRIRRAARGGRQRTSSGEGATAPPPSSPSSRCSARRSGVAIGAALASLLPSTETEDKLMGEASDAVKGTRRPGRFRGAGKREERGEQGRGPDPDGGQGRRQGRGPVAGRRRRRGAQSRRRHEAGRPRAR